MYRDFDLGEVWECPFFVSLAPETLDAADISSSAGTTNALVHYAKQIYCHPGVFGLASYSIFKKCAAAPGTSDAAAPETSDATETSDAAEAVRMLCVSPYPHHRPERPTNPCLYWLGRLQGGRFDLEAASGA